MNSLPWVQHKNFLVQRNPKKQEGISELLWKKKKIKKIRDLIELPRSVEQKLMRCFQLLQKYSQKGKSAAKILYKSKYIQIDIFNVYIQIISWEGCNHAALRKLYDILWRLYIMEAALRQEASQGADRALCTLLSWLYYPFLGQKINFKKTNNKS